MPWREFIVYYFFMLCVYVTNGTSKYFFITKSTGMY